LYIYLKIKQGIYKIRFLETERNGTKRNEMTSSYDPSSANIRVMVNGLWRDAVKQEREAYIAYKSRDHYYRETPHTHDNGITIFRAGSDSESPSEENDDPYMPTYFKMKDSNKRYPIIDMNDIYIFLTEGVTGKTSRDGAGWVKSRNYQTWAYVDFMYDTSATRKCYMSRYSTYLAFPPKFDSKNVVTIDIDEELPPNIIFSISRNENNSVYYEKNESIYYETNQNSQNGQNYEKFPIRIRICDNEYARTGYLGFYTRITMDPGIIITNPDSLENVD